MWAQCELEKMGHVQLGLCKGLEMFPTISEACDPWELQSQPTAPAAKGREPPTLRISLAQTGLLSMASNSRMSPFLPCFNDLSPLEYAPWVTVMFSGVDRWVELHLSVFGVLTESEVIFCLAWLILASSSYYFTYFVSLPPVCHN